MKKAKQSAKKPVATKRHVSPVTNVVVSGPQHALIQEIVPFPDPLQQTVAPRLKTARVWRVAPHTIILGMLIFLSLGAAVYFWRMYAGLKTDSEATAENEAVAQVIEQIAERMVLPEGEMPTVATVKDLEPLKDQAFFKNARLGDKLLIYTDAGKAILYRPSEDKIVEVAPLNSNTEQ